MKPEEYKCEKCGNDTFRLYDVGLDHHIEWKVVCAKCGEAFWIAE